MWILLDETLGSLKIDNGNLRSALEQLLYSVSRGEHALAGKPGTVRELLKYEFSPVPKAILKQVLDQAPSLMAGVNQALYRIRILADGTMPIRHSQGEWRIPLEWIHVNGVPTSYVLGENARDAELFRASAQHQRALSRRGNAFRVDIGGGGGADTPLVLVTEIASKRRFILCITDSDKSCPDSPINHTSNECRKIVDGTNWVATHLSLSAREIENFVPINIIEDTINSLSPSEFDGRLEVLKSLLEINEDAWSYFDLKDGTSLRLAFASSSEFWRLFVEGDHCKETSDPKCLIEEKCLAHCREACKCQIAPPLGHRIIDRVRDYLANHSVHTIARRSSTSLNYSGWAYIGDIVCSWGAATPKLRS